MIKPYDEIIQSMLHEFRGLGFLLGQNTDYRTLLVAEGCSLAITTERGHQPSISASLIDSDGQEFEVGLSMRILADTQFRAGTRELDEIKKQYQLDVRGGDARLKANGTYVYIKVAMRQIFAFVSEFCREILVQNGPFRAEYQSRERQLLNELGL